MKPILIIGIVILIAIIFKITKDSFYNIKESEQDDHDLYYRPHVFTSEVTPVSNNTLTKLDFENLFDNLIKTIY